MKTIYPDTVSGIVNRVTGSPFNYQAWPTVCQDENGTLYAVASGFRVRHVCPFGKTVMYISRDRGNTWTPPIIINDTYLDDRDAGILYLGRGKMLISWFTRNPQEYRTPRYEALMALTHPMIAGALPSIIENVDTLPPEQRRGASYVRLSRDYGVTWEAPVELPITAPHGPTLCADGSLIYLGREHGPTGPLADKTKHYRVKLLRSRDEGKTWTEESVFPEPDWLQPGEKLCEPHVLELPDGRLLGAVRLEKPQPYTILTAYSEDGGKSWTEPARTDVSGAPPHLLRHSSGALICTYGRRELPYGQRAMVSYDEGKTWAEEYVLTENTVARDLGYGSTVELADGSLLSVYYEKFPGDEHASILYTKWALKP